MAPIWSTVTNCLVGWRLEADLLDQPAPWTCPRAFMVVGDLVFDERRHRHKPGLMQFYG